MGADNITYCPKCFINEGKTTNYIQNDLREYIDIGVNLAGILLITYECKCKECNFTYTYEKKIKII